MKKVIYGVLTFVGAVLIATPLLQAEDDSSAAIVDYNPNERLQAFFESLPQELQSRISAYRVKATDVESEVQKYNEQPLTGLPPASFKTAQRKRMKIEALMASLRLEQKAIAKEYYDLLATGWEPPNNSNIVRLLVASTDEHPTS